MKNAIPRADWSVLGITSADWPVDAAFGAGLFFVKHPGTTSFTAMAQQSQDVKVMVVGDGSVGKTYVF